MQRPVVSAQQKHKNKASYNRDYIVPDLTDFFFAIIEKRSKRRSKKEIFKFVKSTVLTKNGFVVSNF